jgi:N-acetylmuramic acid 6-phosphate etherase
MSATTDPDHKISYLGIETGATRSTVLKVDSAGREQFRANYGPANLRMMTDKSLHDFFDLVKIQSGDVSAIAVGMAGLRTLEDKNRVTRLANEVWPDIPIFATGDMELAVESAGPWIDQADALVLLLSGTGSCAYGVNREGRTIRFGGRGHMLGDQGSACDIALKALRAIVYQYDLQERLPELGQAMLRVLQLNHPDELISWSQVAEKQDIGRLAITVFEEALKNDLLALSVIDEAARSLSDMALRCADHLVEAGGRVQFVLTGGTLLKQPSFTCLVSQLLKDSRPFCKTDLMKRENVWGAVELARKLVSSEGALLATLTESPQSSVKEVLDLNSLAGSPTELRNPRSTHLDTMRLEDAIKLMIDENVVAVQSILNQQDDLKWLIEQTVTAFKKGGRLFYAGAGTSGRLGILDASECPPTFRVSAEQVQGIMAGGTRAIWSAVEGAEDSYIDGASAVMHRGVRSGDVLLGIASSGRTPFVWGAMAEAKKLGAITCLLCFNPEIKVSTEDGPDRIMAVDSGPEVLTGSTRLKAGTATKVILNTLTTLAMTHTGKVMGNLMVDLNASNDKLRHRAVRIVQNVTGCDEAAAKEALQRNAWIVKMACLELEQTSCSDDTNG